MSSLIDELAAPPPKAATFAAWLLEQTPDTRKALEAAGKDLRWSNHGLMGVLRKYGAPCSKESITAWRVKLGVAD